MDPMTTRIMSSRTLYETDDQLVIWVSLRMFCIELLNLYIVATFLSESLEAHVEALMELNYEARREISDQSWENLVGMCQETGLDQLTFRIGIATYVQSRAFDTADAHFRRFISRCVNTFDAGNIRALLDGIEGNNQT